LLGVALQNLHAVDILMSRKFKENNNTLFISYRLVTLTHPPEQLPQNPDDVYTHSCTILYCNF